MYRGSNPAAQRSQEMLAASLGELMEEKPFKSITVSELCTRAGVSRQTFYTLFGSKENTLLYILENAPGAGGASPGSVSSMSLGEVCSRYARYVALNYGTLRMLIDNDLAGLLNTLIHQSMSTCVQSFAEATDAEDREYLATFVSAGLCSLARSYVTEHLSPDAERLAELAYKIVSGRIYRS